MKLTENTKVRIKVPKHLYEAVQAELAKSQEMEEMATPHDGHKKIKEDTDAQRAAEDLMGAISSGDPFFTGLALVGAVVGGVLAGPKIIDTVKGYWEALTDKKPAQADKLAAAAEKAGMDIDGDGKKPAAEPVAEGEREGVYNDFAKWKESFPEETEFAQENNYMVAKDSEGKELGKWNPVKKQGMHADDFQYKNLEETFDLVTLMEAVKDLSKKKADEKKKKAEADKKKKEAEAKKKADAKKKK